MDTEADLLAPIVTPFDGGDGSDGDDDGVDEQSLATLVESVVDAGLDGVVPCGSTGEFAALSNAEYETVVETTVEHAGDRFVLAGAGGTAIGTVRQRIQVATEAGADAVLVVAPYYDEPPEPAGNERFFAAALADAEIPAYLYNVPSLVGQEIDVDTVASLADCGLIAGIKDSSGDLRYLGDLLRRSGDELTVYQGYDAAFVPSLVLGVDGGVNALAQVIPEVFADAADAVEGGDVAAARSAQLDRIDATYEVCLDCGPAALVKAILAERGTISSAGLRPPLLEPPAEALERARETL